MKMLKSAALLALCGALTLSLAACGGKDAGETVAQAREKLKACTSLDAVFTVESAYQSGEDTMAVGNHMEVTMFTDPARIKASVSTSYDGESTTSITVYSIPEGEGYAQYMTNGTDWIKQSVAADQSSSYDAREEMLRYLEGATGFKAVGEEDVDGVAAGKYTGTLAGEALVTLLDSSGALRSISEMSEELQAKIRENLKKIPGLPITVWLDKAEGYPVKFYADLAKTMEDMNKNISDTLGGYQAETEVTITASSTTILCKNFNAATEFELPPEAANATEVDAAAK